MVVVVELVPAAFSALVSLGGVISGVFLGVASETLRAAARGQRERASSAPAAASHRRRAHSGSIRRPQVGQSLRSFWAS